MGMGRRTGERQQERWVATSRVASAPQHNFYDKLNRLLDEAGFDAFAEEFCEPFYKQSGRRSIPPGRSFRCCRLANTKVLTSLQGAASRQAAGSGAGLPEQSPARDGKQGPLAAAAA